MARITTSAAVLVAAATTFATATFSGATCTFAASNAVVLPGHPTPSAAFPKAPTATHTVDSDWWTTSYLVDYGLVALGGAAYFLRHDVPSTSAMIGPVYDPDDPAAILDPSYSDRIGRTHLTQHDGETVSTATATMMVAAGSIYLIADGAIGLLGDRPDAVQRLHDTFIGYLETVALTTGGNAVIKNMVGRLRPDFQDRARRHHCAAGDIDKKYCPKDNQPLSLDADEAEEIWLDGRRSFMSGHAVSAVNWTTYVSLAIGGEYVWGRDATFTSRSIGLATQAVLMTTGVFVAASRVDDGRHHVGDVLAGSAFGFAIANFSYWRRFALDGTPRSRKDEAVALSLDPGPGEVGLAFTVRYR